MRAMLTSKATWQEVSKRWRWFVNVVFASLAALLTGLVVCAAAQGYVYFTNTGLNAIGRANLDGTVPDYEFIVGASQPWGIAVNGSYIYWTNSANGTIGRANLNGSEVNENFITGLGGEPLGLAINAHYIFWADKEGNEGYVGRAELSGANPEELFTTEYFGPPDGIAVTETELFVALQTSNAIASSGIDGSNAAIFVKTLEQPLGLAIDGNQLYWAGRGLGGDIGRVNLDGSEQDEDFVNNAVADGLAVYGNDLYWDAISSVRLCTGSGVGADGAIGRVTLQDSEFDPTLIPCAVTPQGVAVDGLSSPPPPPSSASTGVSAKPGSGPTGSGPTGSQAPPLSKAQVEKDLLIQNLTPRGASARIRQLLRKRSYTMSIEAFEPSSVLVFWYQTVHGAHHKATRKLVAHGSVILIGGKGKIRISLTRAGEKLLRAHLHGLALEAVGTFIAGREKPVTVAQRFTLH